MYIINILVKPSENKNSHRKHCLSHLYRSVFEVLQMPHIHTNNTDSLMWARHAVSDWLKSQKALHRSSNITLRQVCRGHWNSFIKTLQDRESFTINKRGKTLLLPLCSYKTASYYFIFKFDLYKTEKNKKKNMLWYEECCKSLKTLWKAINQWLVARILTSFASMVQKTLQSTRP